MSRISGQKDELFGLCGPILGFMVNEWRRRNVSIYEHKGDLSKVITVGEPFGGGEPVVCVEERVDWEPALVKIRGCRESGSTYVYR